MAFLLVGMSSLAQAVPIPFTDVVQPASVPGIAFNANFPGLLYLHDINDNGYNPATDTLISAEIIFLVRDDIRNEAPFPYDPPADPMIAILDDFAHIYSYEVNLVDIVQPVDLALLTDGLLYVYLGIPQPNLPQWQWDFYRSTLNVIADRRVDVPLPGTLLLVAGGMLSLGWSRRARRRVI